MVRILVASDEQGLGAAIGMRFASAPGYSVQLSPLADWPHQALRHLFDLLMGLDDQALLDRLSQLRRAGSDVPAIVLTLAADAGARVRALRAGADDVLIHPSDPEELLLRAARLTRPPIACRPRTLAGGLVIDRLDRRIWRDGREITLLPREYQLLMCLARSPGTIFDRRALLGAVWKLSFDPGTNVVEVHMSRLRAKIDRGFDRTLIETVKGRGYRFAAACECAGSPELSDLTGDSGLGLCRMTFTERAGVRDPPIA